MPINHKQERYDAMLLDTQVTPLQAFEALGVVRPCCRTVLDRAARDCRLRRRFTEPRGFAVIRYAPKGSSVYTLSTDGSTEARDDHVAMPRTVTDAPLSSSK